MMSFTEAQVRAAVGRQNVTCLARRKVHCSLMDIGNRLMTLRRMRHMAERLRRSPKSDGGHSHFKHFRL